MSVDSSALRPVDRSRLYEDLVERLAVIVRFLAVLELCKQGLVDLDQGAMFGELHIVWVGGAGREKIDVSALDIEEYQG